MYVNNNVIMQRLYLGIIIITKQHFTITTYDHMPQRHMYKYSRLFSIISSIVLSQNTTNQYTYALLNQFMNRDLGICPVYWSPRHPFLVFNLQVHVIIFIILIIIFIAEYSCIIVLLYVRPQNLSIYYFFFITFEFSFKLRNT